MGKVKTFEAKVEDKLGWDYDDALVAIRFSSESTKKTRSSEDCVSDYVEALEVGIVLFTANFWGKKEHQLKGKASRPLLRESFVPAEIVYEMDTHGEFLRDNRGQKVKTDKVIAGYWEWTETFEVDLDHPESLEILNNNSTAEEKIDHLIELEVVRSFA